MVVMAGLVPAIPGLMMDFIKEQVRAIKEWAARSHVDTVRLFGSRAKSCARADSDVDLAVTASDGDYVRFADDWEEELSKALNLSVAIKQYNSTADDTVRRYCAECSIQLYP